MVIVPALPSWRGPKARHCEERSDAAICIRRANRFSTRAMGVKKMKKHPKYLAGALCLTAATVAMAATPAAPAPVASGAVAAKPQAHAAFTGPDYSGFYACKGVDSHEGPYTATVTLSLVREQSAGRNGAYDFVMEVPGYGRYLGQAASHPGALAIHFALTDPAPKDYGTGIATVSKTAKGQWQFAKYYYEPAFKGGNFGHETCVQK
jgi:hypothetical protein